MLIRITYKQLFVNNYCSYNKQEKLEEKDKLPRKTQEISIILISKV